MNRQTISCNISKTAAKSKTHVFSKVVVPYIFFFILWYHVYSLMHMFEWWCQNHDLNFLCEKLNNIGHWLKITYYENDHDMYYKQIANKDFCQLSKVPFSLVYWELFSVLFFYKKCRRPLVLGNLVRLSNLSIRYWQNNGSWWLGAKEDKASKVTSI